MCKARLNMLVPNRQEIQQSKHGRDLKPNTGKKKKIS